MRYALRVLSFVAGDILLVTLAMVLLGMMIAGADWISPGAMATIVNFIEVHSTVVGTLCVLAVSAYLVARYAFGISPFPKKDQRLTDDVH
jgi:hypothetical protein